MTKRSLLLSTLLVGSISSIASAAPLVFTDRASFETALGATGTTPIVEVIDQTLPTIGSFEIDLIHNGTGSLLTDAEVDLQLLQTALSLDFSSNFPLEALALDWDISLITEITLDVNGSPFTLGPQQNSGFFGFINESSFSQFNLAAAPGAAQLPVFSNFADNTQDIPEPASLALFGIGLLGLGAYRQCKSIKN